MTEAADPEAKLRAAIDALEPEVLAQRPSEKWNTFDADILPAWVAEMDFPLCEPVRRVLERAIELEDLGYPLNPNATGVREAFASRMADRFGWHVDFERVEVMADVMQGLFIGLDCLSEPGSEVVAQTPVYPPFLKAVRESGRLLVENHLVRRGARWEIDWDDLERALVGGARTLLLCHPQNPTGRVFDRGELEHMAELVLRHDVVVLADEIHADLVFDGRRHVPFASLAPEVEARTVTFNSASKSFNTPGLRCAVAHFGSPGLQKRFLGHVPRRVRGGLGMLGLEATVAAWRDGDAWLDVIVDVLDENRRYLDGLLRKRFPELDPSVPEGTYLTWVDFAPLGLDGSPAARFREQGRVALTDGRSFGTGYRDFARINFATSKSILDEVVERMAQTVDR